ncbi:unnamed protein product, partial [Caretta caretta]
MEFVTGYRAEVLDLAELLLGWHRLQAGGPRDGHHQRRQEGHVRRLPPDPALWLLHLLPNPRLALGLALPGGARGEPRGRLCGEDALQLRDLQRTVTFLRLDEEDEGLETGQALVHVQHLLLVTDEHGTVMGLDFQLGAGAPPPAGRAPPAGAAGPGAAGPEHGLPAGGGGAPPAPAAGRGGPRLAQVAGAPAAPARGTAEPGAHAGLGAATRLHLPLHARASLPRVQEARVPGAAGALPAVPGRSVLLRAVPGRGLGPQPRGRSPPGLVPPHGRVRGPRPPAGRPALQLCRRGDRRRVQQGGVPGRAGADPGVLGPREHAGPGPRLRCGAGGQKGLDTRPPAERLVAGVLRVAGAPAGLPPGRAAQLPPERLLHRHPAGPPALPGAEHPEQTVAEDSHRGDGEGVGHGPPLLGALRTAAPRVAGAPVSGGHPAPRGRRAAAPAAENGDTGGARLARPGPQGQGGAGGAAAEILRPAHPPAAGPQTRPGHRVQFRLCTEGHLAQCPAPPAGAPGPGLLHGVQRVQLRGGRGHGLHGDGGQHRPAPRQPLPLALPPGRRRQRHALVRQRLHLPPAVQGGGRGGRGSPRGRPRPPPPAPPTWSPARPAPAARRSGRTVAAAAAN